MQEVAFNLKFKIKDNQDLEDAILSIGWQLEHNLSRQSDPPVCEVITDNFQIEDYTSKLMATTIRLQKIIDKHNQKKQKEKLN